MMTPEQELELLRGQFEAMKLDRQRHERQVSARLALQARIITKIASLEERIEREANRREQ